MKKAHILCEFQGEKPSPSVITPCQNGAKREINQGKNAPFSIHGPLENNEGSEIQGIRVLK